MAHQPSDSGADQRIATPELEPPGTDPAQPRAAASSRRRFSIGVVDLLAGTLWLAIALGVVLFVTHSPPFTGSKHRQLSSQTDQAAAQPTVAATGVPAAAPAAASATAVTPAPPLLTGAPPDADLLRPGAALIERIDLAPAGVGRTSVVYSSAAGVDGCAHPYVDVLRASSGGWKPVWAATSSPIADGPLIPAINRSDAGCFPRVALVAVRGLDGSRPGLALSVVEADGSQRVVVVDLAGTPEPAVVASLNLAPELALSASDSANLTLEATEPLPAPAAAGDGAWRGQTVAQISQRFAWRGGTFAGDGWVATPTCLDGTVAARTAGAEPVLVVRCTDGDRYAAVQLPADAIIPEGLRAEDLHVGDDVQITLAQSTAGAMPKALPSAARVYSAAAQNRALIAAAATAAPAELPRTPVPTRAATAPPPTATAISAPPVAATSVASAPNVTVPQATRPPAQATRPPAVAPVATVALPVPVPTRTVPPQPTAPPAVRTVPPQP
ncbi:MAG TPA: hypothetical protein VFD32_06485 [Dehalococcoidia bacterium]|nr:hypothetical protein [Dehalococcoidia bacterium]